MKNVKVKLNQNSYDIVFDSFNSENFEERFLKLSENRAVLTVGDKKIQQLYPLMAYRYGKFFALAGGEDNKNLSEIERLCEYGISENLDRKSLFVAIGGGITGDMTGFAAAIFMRGVEFIQVPTTLLAMVDSSVGGKTGVNSASGKNLIGAFKQPKLVLIDVNFLKTLPEREIKNGLAEVIKYAFALDEKFFELLSGNVDKINSLDLNFYNKIIHRSCEIKADIVAQDEKETKNVRALLNYGHTFGHALENLSNYEISHGEGVAIGMNIAGNLSQLLNLWSESDYLKQLKLIKDLNLRYAIPRNIKIDDITEVMTHDKKASRGKINFVLPTAIGSSEVFSNIDMEIVKKALEESYE